MPGADAVESCEDLAEMMQDPQSAEEYAESGEEIDVAGLFNTGMWNLGPRRSMTSGCSRPD